MKKVLALVSVLTFVALVSVSCGPNSRTETAVSTQTDSLVTDSTQVEPAQKDSSLIDLKSADSTK